MQFGVPAAVGIGIGGIVLGAVVASVVFIAKGSETAPTPTPTEQKAPVVTEAMVMDELRKAVDLVGQRTLMKRGRS